MQILVFGAAWLEYLSLEIGKKFQNCSAGFQKENI